MFVRFINYNYIRTFFLCQYFFKKIQKNVCIDISISNDIIIMVINLVILFKNKTKYTKQMYKDFLEFHDNKFGFKESFYIIFISMLIIFCIILYIYNKYYLQSILFSMILLFFLYWKIIKPIKEVKKDFNSEKITEEETFKFIFCNSYFKIFNNLKYSKIRYFNLYKVFETNKFIYFYLDNEHALLLDKDGFYFGDKNDFSKFIKKKCWYKYKNTSQ